MPKNIFDFDDLSDLPAELRKQLCPVKAAKASVFLDILKQADRALTRQELRAAVWRVTGVLKTNSSVSTALSVMKILGEVRQPKRGYWEAV